MIYIHKTAHIFFQSLSRIIELYLIHNVSNEGIIITNDLTLGTEQDIWILNWLSFKKGIKKKNYIAIQTEPMQKRGVPEFKEWLNNALEIWDYADNLDIGYSKIWELQKEDSKEIDVLFYGALSERRLKLLNELIQKIPNVFIAQNITGFALERLLTKTKIVLCMFYYDYEDNDMSRIAPLVSKRNFIIAEECKQKKYSWLGECIITGKKEQLIDLCKQYLSQPMNRLKQTEQSYQYLLKNHPFKIKNIKSL